jgi:hypothetical protein
VNPKYEIITVYAHHGDGGERGTGPILGYCSTRPAAEVAAYGQGWYGGNGWVSDCPALKIGDAVFVLAHKNPIDLDGKRSLADAELKAKTLADLTDDQKRVLGL